MKTLLHAGVLLTLSLGPASVLQAQPADDGLATLRTKASLTDAERATLREWINQRVLAVVSDDQAAAQQAFAQLRTGSDGSAEFRQAFAATCLETLSSAYKKAGAAPAARLITLLAVVQDPRSLDLLLEAVQDERTAVRAAAAVALRSLRPKLAGGDALARVINALREAARQESSRRTLELMYRALDCADVPSATDRRAGAEAVLSVLEARLERLASGQVRAEGAETVGLQVAGRAQGVFDEAARRRYTVVLARLLHYAVQRYAAGENPLCKVREQPGGPDVELRNAIELVIAEAEKQLARLLSPSQTPQVTERMRAADHVNMINEMNRWAGLLKGSTGLDLTIQPPAEGGEAATGEGGARP